MVFLSALFSVSCCKKADTTNSSAISKTSVQNTALSHKNTNQYQVKDSLPITSSNGQQLPRYSQDPVEKGRVLIEDAEKQLNAGRYYESEKILFNVLSFYEIANDTEISFKAYYLLGQTYKGLNDFNHAFYYLNKAEKIADKQIYKVKTWIDIAGVYIGRQDFKKALSVLSASKDYKFSKENILLKADYLDKTGYALYKTNDVSGLDNLKEALEIRMREKCNTGIVESSLHLSEFYKDTDPTLSKDYAENAYSKAKEINNLFMTKDALALLIHHDEGPLLKNYINEYLTLEDAIINDWFKATQQYPKILSEYREKVNENLKLKNETTQKALLLQESKYKNKLLLISLIFSFLSSVLLYFLIRSKHRREKLLESYATETRISKKVHDEIANEIYNTLNYTSTHDIHTAEKKDKVISSLNKIYSLTRNISRESSSIDIGPLFPMQLKSMLAEYRTDNVNIIIKGLGTIDWKEINDTKKIATYRCLQELMVNMKKHSDASLVIIDFKTENNKLLIKYSDNGVGIKKNKIILKNGLQNVENRMESLNGSVTFDLTPRKGFHLTLNYPVYQHYVQKSFNSRRHR